MLFLSITHVNPKLNNNAVLLPNVTQEQRYKASVASGLKNMIRARFRGQSVSVSNSQVASTTSEGESRFSGVGAYAPNNGGAGYKQRRGSKWLQL